MFCCDRVVVNAPSKINLTLDITGVTNEKYHKLETVMQTIGLSDIIIIEKNGGNGNEIKIGCSNLAAPQDDTNIAYKAAIRFFEYIAIPILGLAIYINKHIPIQAGLGGGSADAAGVIVGLNRLFETGLSTEQMCEIGLFCGADVPFCIVGGCCFAQGVGEILTPIDNLPQCFITIAKPQVGMSTQKAFARYDEMTKMTKDIDCPQTNKMLDAIKAKDLFGIGQTMFNVFEQVDPLEEVERLKEIMLCHGALGAVMSGSGTAVCGLFTDKNNAQASIKSLKATAPEVFLTKPESFGAQVIHIN